MKDSYISSRAKIISKDNYAKVGTYILRNDEIPAATIYTPLPEEYSIFSEIDLSFFSLCDTEQHCLLSMCLQYLKKQLLKLYMQFGVVRILPKLSASFDDEAIILNWAYTNFRIYFNFENSLNSSYYGIVAQINEENIFTNSGKLNKSNYANVIDVLLQFVIEYS